MPILISFQYYLNMEIFSYKNMCRLCLNKDRTLTRIFPENSTGNSPDSLAQKIMACVGIEVEPGENLPDQVCNVCTDELDRWQRFKKLCECSNEELITGMPPLPDEVLEKNLQKSNSDILETSSDFGLGDVSLLEHDSLFNSIDGFKDANIVGNDLITSKPFSTLFKNDIDHYENWNKSEEQVRKEAEESVVRESRKSKWREHYSRNYMKKYNCGLCSEDFSKFSLLLQHDKIVHNDIVMSEVCVKCDRLFVSQQRLDVHHQMKHKDTVYECDICGLISVSEKSIKVHKNRHSGRFSCDICGLTTNSNRSLHDHKLVHAAAQERPSYVCGVCGRMFKNKQTLDAHSITHLTNKLEWKCKVCNREFKNQQYFNRHKKTHSADKLAICEECGAVLKSEASLYSHKLIHKEKKHMCQVCDKMFHTKYLLTRHMEVHAEPSYVCSICSRVFSRNDILMTHLKIHQESQLFPCNICDKTFTLKIYLKRHHLRIHKKDN